MSPALDTQDEIYRFNTLKPIADPNHEIQQKGFREIVLGAREEEEQDLWLRLRDDEFTWNNLYLGRSKTFKKGAAPKRYNVIVPIVPRCYSTPERNPAEAIRPPKGWIYIIRQFDTPKGTAVELWRELASDRLGNFRDVNLKKYKGRDHRKATGQGGFRIIVPYCINNLGTMYDYGNGLSQNYAKALHWYTKAAQQGNAKAELNMGNMYLHGKGVDVDYKRAYGLFRQSAMQGELLSIYNIGQMYTIGAAVPKSIVMAFAHYKIAIATKDKDIIQDYNTLKSKMTPAQIRAGEQEATKLKREYGLE